MKERIPGPPTGSRRHCLRQAVAVLDASNRSAKIALSASPPMREVSSASCDEGYGSIRAGSTGVSLPMRNPIENKVSLTRAFIATDFTSRIYESSLDADRPSR
jgi:hypothetical protein